ncbi:MAG: hypothetical protein AABX29_05270 [Nanoarchaeota archaeon]
MYSKKGMEENIRNIILILVGAIVIILVITMVYLNTKDIVMHKMCTWSIVFKDTFILGTNLCYTDDKEVSGKEKEAVMKDIAEKMVECWKRMDEGRTPIDTSWFIGGQVCFKCYRIKIIGLKDTITYEEFYKFLIKNPIKGKEESYSTFFKKYDEDNAIVLLGKSGTIKSVFIDSEQDTYYTVAFKGYAPQGKGSMATTTIAALKLAPFTSGWSIVAGITSLTANSISYWISENSIIVAPYNKLDEVCSSTLR